MAKNVLLKVILLGDGGAGKSCLMNRFVSNRFDSHSFHTIGVEFLDKEIEVDGDTFKLQIWDTAGQERFKSLRTPFYRGSDICLLTFALDDKQSFANLGAWKDEFLYYADANEESFPFVVLGNKCDIESEHRQIATETAQDWCDANGKLPYIETSAKIGTNTDQAFKIAVAQWLKLDAKIEKFPNSRSPGVTLPSGGGHMDPELGDDRSCCFAS